jgi:hypothetical protein
VSTARLLDTLRQDDKHRERAIGRKPVSLIGTPAILLLDDALAGHHWAQSGGDFARLARTDSSTGNARIFEPGKRAVRICEIFITDDKDIYSYTSGVLQNLEAVS